MCRVSSHPLVALRGCITSAKPKVLHQSRPELVAPLAVPPLRHAGQAVAKIETVSSVLAPRRRCGSHQAPREHQEHQQPDLCCSRHWAARDLAKALKNQMERKPEGQRTARAYFKLLSDASRPEIVNVGDLNGHLQPAETTWKRSPTLSNRFCGGRWPFRPQKSAISGPQARLGNLN